MGLNLKKSLKDVKLNWMMFISVGPVALGYIMQARSHGKANIDKPFLPPAPTSSLSLHAKSCNLVFLLIFIDVRGGVEAGSGEAAPSSLVIQRLTSQATST